MLDLSIMPFVGGFFWIFFGVFFSGCLLLKAIGAGSAVRNLFMIITSLYVITMTQAAGARLFFVICMLITTVFVYFSGKILLSSDSRHRKTICILSIVSVVLFLCWFKYDQIQQIFSSKIIFIIGVSYFSFKYIHFLADCFKKNIKKINLLTFLNYIFFFPGFFIGPINRFNPFFEDLNTGQYDHDIIGGIKRIIEGIFKKIVLASFFFPYSLAAFDLSETMSISKFQAFLAVYAYGLYVYFDFSGYTDMAIGCGKLVGINLPENFNKPFIKRNLQQFWANWHMSLTQWLTDYIYWPLVRRLRHAVIFKQRMVTLSCVCIIITFMICGLWHGNSINFFYWGAFHGIGLAILNIYKHIVKHYFTRQQQIFVNKSKIAYVVSNFITIQYVSLSFIFFAFSPDQMSRYFLIFCR